MKNFKNYLACLSVFALLFSSCSKDENTVNDPNEKASLSFGAMVEDLADRSTDKQSDVSDLPECTDDTPAYVEIVLLDGETEAAVVGTTADPFRVDLVAGQVFTEEVPELQLDPGSYILDHFSVYNADGDLIWLAPKGGVLEEFVDMPLPLTINLGAGVKKYVDVSVLCYDDRDVNEYGYMFFEFDTNEAFEFCFFANYCPPSGRHYPARISVDISIDGEVIYSDEINNTGINGDGDAFAEPICFALPDLPEYADDEEYIDYTVTLLDFPNVYDAENGQTISGSLSRDEVMANFDGDDNVEYEHLRFGCDGTTPPPGDDDDDGVPNEDDVCPGFDDNADADSDGIPDGCDECPGHDDDVDTDGDGMADGCDDCPNVASGNDNDNDCIPNNEDDCPNDPTNECNGGGDDDGDVLEGCETAFMFGNHTFMNGDGDDLNLGNNWGWAQWVQVDVEDGEFTEKVWAAAGQNDLDKGSWIGNVTVTVNGDDVEVTLDPFEGNEFELVHIYFSDDKPETNAPGQYGNEYDPATDGLSYEFTDANADGTFWLIVHAEACGEGAED